MLEVRQNTTTRGHKHNFFKPRARLNIRVVNDGNSLTNTVVESQTLNTFKARLNK